MTPVPTTPMPTTPASTTREPTTPVPKMPVPTTPPPTCPPMQIGAAYYSVPFRLYGYDLSGCCALCVTTPGCTSIAHQITDCVIQYNMQSSTPTWNTIWTSAIMPSPKPTCQQHSPSPRPQSNLVYANAAVEDEERCCMRCSIDGSKYKGFCYDGEDCLLLDAVA